MNKGREKKAQRETERERDLGWKLLWQTTPLFLSFPQVCQAVRWSRPCPLLQFPAAAGSSGVLSLVAELQLCWVHEVVLYSAQPHQVHGRLSGGPGCHRHAECCIRTVPSQHVPASCPAQNKVTQFGLNYFTSLLLKRLWRDKIIKIIAIRTTECDGQSHWSYSNENNRMWWTKSLKL